MSELTMKMFAGQPIDADEIQDNISMVTALIHLQDKYS